MSYACLYKARQEKSDRLGLQFPFDVFFTQAYFYTIFFFFL